MTSAPLTLVQKASRLLDLHHASQPLVLINAWDAASAAMIEHCGLPAIATSSAAMANALGFPDGQFIPWPQMLDAVVRVCRAVQVPVTADIESGFAANVTALETSITQIIQAGAVGVNLEDVMPANPALQNDDLQNDDHQNDDHQNDDHQNDDLQNNDLQNADAKNTVSENRGLGNTDPQNADHKNTDPENIGPQNTDHKTADSKNAGPKNSGPENADAKNANSKNAGPVRHGSPLFPLTEQIVRIQAARRAAHAAGIHLVINARTDAYWQAGVEPAEAMRNTLERGKAYLQAGADCIFIPGLRNPDHIKTVIDHLSASLHTGNLPDADLRTNDLPNAALPTPDPRTNDPRSVHQDEVHRGAVYQDAVHRVAPVNILAGPGVPSIPELAKLGVKRISYGSGPHRAAMGLLRRMAGEARTSGTFKALTEGAVPYEEINALMTRR